MLRFCCGTFARIGDAIQFRRDGGERLHMLDEQRPLRTRQHFNKGGARDECRDGGGPRTASFLQTRRAAGRSRKVGAKGCATTVSIEILTGNSANASGALAGSSDAGANLQQQPSASVACVVFEEETATVATTGVVVAPDSMQQEERFGTATENRAREEEMKNNSRSRIKARINRVSGQVNGIGRMIEEDKHCVDILNQIAAARSALGIELLTEHLETCVFGHGTDSEHACANPLTQEESIVEV